MNPHALASPPTPGSEPGPALGIDVLEAKAEDAARLLAALAHPKRLMALCHLLEGELPVGRLAETIGLSPSALSQHLARMRDLRLVETRRDGQTIYYRVASEAVRAVIEALCHADLGGPPRLMAPLDGPA